VRDSVANLAVFPRIWACFFVELRVFLKTCGLLVLGLILIEIRLFFGVVFRRFLFCGLLFFQILWDICCFNILLKAYWACFYKKIFILDLFLRICHLAFIFNFLAGFSFCWIFLPTHVGLVFRWNYRFLACFSNLLVCFCNITWHHWWRRVADWRSVFWSDWCIAAAQLPYHRTSVTGSFYLFAGSCFEQYSQFVSFSEM